MPMGITSGPSSARVNNGFDAANLKSLGSAPSRRIAMFDPLATPRDPLHRYSCTPGRLRALPKGEKMKRFVTQLSLCIAAAVLATGCTPVRHNLPPEQRMMEPGPGVGGPGPGVLSPPAMAPGPMGAG